LNGQPLVKIEGASTYYYHNDHLATPQKMTDSSGTVVWSADYKPFGEATVTVSTITNNLRFPGQYFDAETGLLYNLNRTYNPVPGRYNESDPIGIAPNDRGELNHLYIYVNNNPITRTDPTGLQECPDCTKADPLPASSSKCDDYTNETYLGVSVKCFCKCAGDGSWSQKVRGCLACEHKKGTSPYVSHARCYLSAGMFSAPYITLGSCYKQCYVGH